MKKILIVSTVSRQFYLFEQGNIKVLKALGYEVHGAANFNDAIDRLDVLDIKIHHFDIQRSPFSFINIKAYIQLKKIMKSENFNAVHCHSPMGGVLARLSAKAVGLSPVIYTAHGFHFYKGAPLKNWLLYYPIEKWLSKHTDMLITINKEDFNRALNFKTCKVCYVPGVGINTKMYNQINFDRLKKRKELGISEKSFLLLSIGELNKNKNHETIIKALAKINNSDIQYVICGHGELNTYLKNLVKKVGLSENVKFLGFRNDINEICQAADLFVFPSLREGLSVSLMEAMAAGLPVLCSNIRGNSDLIEDRKGGYLVKPTNVENFALCISGLKNDIKHRGELGKYNIKRINDFRQTVVLNKMKKIYESILS